MTTILFTDTQSIVSWLETKRTDAVVGFVPTMGALHDGHSSLFEIARSQCDIVIASIYVNNLQFNSPSDFARYPRTLDEDFVICESCNVDAVWAPSQTDLFADKPNVLATNEDADGYEGKDRPGHFAGVITVVDRLLSTIRPDRMYLGAKDHQQVSVIHTMCLQQHPVVKIVRCPTIRERDGLAMSSRNRFLTETGRIQAAAIPLTLQRMIEAWRDGVTDPNILISRATVELQSIGAVTIHYIAVLDGDSMQQAQQVKVGDTAIIAISLDNVRLIDNMQFINA
jgi:pantoate--beta-alanine ligase